ncbi:MAG: hypothetical protein N4A68_06855 [Maledivibacter sp.]|jgi:hypothetical protein|nr:hypothetical protein [Maledivibacter sp.]
MKIVALPVDMIAWFTKDGIPNPIKFRIVTDDESNAVIKVDRIITRDVEKLAGNKMHVFRCQSYINGIEKTFELKFEVDSCKWLLYKI